MHLINCNYSFIQVNDILGDIPYGKVDKILLVLCEAVKDETSTEKNNEYI